MESGVQVVMVLRELPMPDVAETVVMAEPVGVAVEEVAVTAMPSGVMEWQ